MGALVAKQLNIKLLKLKRRRQGKSLPRASGNVLEVLRNAHFLRISGKVPFFTFRNSKHPMFCQNWIFISIYSTPTLHYFFDKADMRDRITRSIREGVAAVTAINSEEGVAFIESVAWAIIECYRKGGKLLIAGNGGSLCDAMHFAEELTGHFRKPRAPLPAIALADPGHITCVGNDLGFEEIFARSVEALGKGEDVFILLTTSGNSKNLIKAVEVARRKALATVAFLGQTGGEISGWCDHEWILPNFQYSDRIQEAHMVAIHIIIEMVEDRLFCSD